MVSSIVEAIAKDTGTRVPKLIATNLELADNLSCSSRDRRNSDGTEMVAVGLPGRSIMETRLGLSGTTRRDREHGG